MFRGGAERTGVPKVYDDEAPAVRYLRRVRNCAALLLNRDMLSSNSLLSLDPDILLLIFESAYAKGCLQPLSMTCRWIRQLSLPVLFARICLWPRALTPQRFPLSTVRPYIRFVLVLKVSMQLTDASTELSRSSTIASPTTTYGGPTFVAPLKTMPSTSSS